MWKATWKATRNASSMNAIIECAVEHPVKSDVKSDVKERAVCVTDGSNPLLAFSLKALETELEQSRSTTPQTSIPKTRSLYFSQLKKLLPPDKLQAFDTRLSLQEYLRDHAPPVLMSFLRKQHLTCDILSFYLAQDSKMLSKIVKLTSNPSLESLRSTFKLSDSKPSPPSIESLLKPIPSIPSSETYLTSELNYAGSYISNPWLGMLWMESLKKYEIYTEEYIKTLTSEIKKSYGEDLMIHEVGAGSGDLSKGIEDLNKRWLKITASDDNSWGLTSSSLVQRLDVKTAVTNLNEEDKNVIIVSWMPQGVDWTKMFREKGVEGYVLVGEFWDGCCGCNWESWG
ncbi:hypothetical protein TL16_g03970 [Triparma laevis f. inornata]|nr:hypothetical protein TL16_g03970 [Triparma laevis f. inornata]GMH99398.1 hypothetical protein TrLO_g136 [Triparma laevis f. longispina]